MSNNKIKRIAVLTSGGDSPGMNPCIRAVVRTALAYDIEPYFIYDGYLGMYENRIKKVTRFAVSDIVNRGGTIIGSGRFPEFNELAPRQKAVDNLKAHKIDAVVTLGGDGTFIGARNLSHMGINCVGIPCTIDNDIASTDVTIGFNTALETITYAGDHLRDTASSHHQCSILETMGRHCGDLAIFASYGLGSEIISVPELKISKEDIVKIVRAEFDSGKQHVLIVTTENLYNVVELAQYIEKTINVRCRSTILGHVQRGGCPSTYDRFIAAKLGIFAVKALLDGKKSICLGIKNTTEIICTDIDEALALPRPSRKKALEYINLIK